MPRKPKKSAPAKPLVSSTKGSTVTLPNHAPRRARQEGLGAQAAAKPAVTLGGSQKRRMGAAEAGALSPQFGRTSGQGDKGGEAFATWCHRVHGIDTRERRPQSEWEALLAEFAARPVHGHRRKSVGGNHRPNRSDLR